MERTERTATGMAGPFLTPQEAASLARVTPGYIRKLCHRGAFTAVRVGDNPMAPLRIPTEEFLAWLYGEPAPGEPAPVSQADLRPWVEADV